MSELLTLLVDRLDTPIGEMLIVADHEGYLRAIDWAEHETKMHRLLSVQYGPQRIEFDAAPRAHGASSAIAEYFAGQLTAIDDLPVRTAGTPFQHAVWDALRSIPCGATLSYAALAAKIGRPAAVRAVGAANGANPVSVVVPCHRVIGANGSLTGYGGGMHRKSWLLDHESGAARLI